MHAQRRVRDKDTCHRSASLIKNWHNRCFCLISPTCRLYWVRICFRVLYTHVDVELSVFLAKRADDDTCKQMNIIPIYNHL